MDRKSKADDSPIKNSVITFLIEIRLVRIQRQILRAVGVVCKVPTTRNYFKLWNETCMVGSSRYC